MSKQTLQNRALSNRNDPNKNTGCLVLFGLVFALFGSFFVYMFLLAPFIKMTAASNWVEVPCTILSSKVGVSHSSDGGDTYRVEVRFAYHYSPNNLEADPKAPRYESDTYDFSGGVYSSGRSSKTAIVNALKPGTETTCWVNPEQPAEAVLKHGAPDHWWIGLLTLIFPTAGIGIIFLGIYTRRKALLQREGLLPLTHDTTLQANPSTDKATGTQGPIELQQVQSRFGKVIGLGIFNLIWNGVTWTMMYVMVIQAWKSGGGFLVFPLIFLSIFAIVGLILFIAFLHQLLALKNPRLRLTLSKAVLNPSDTIQLSWMCIGAAFRVRSLTLTLEGRESATYRRGTRTSTDTHVFKRLPISVIDDHADMISGRKEFSIPADVPSTFVGSNNKIQWVLIVHGDIPRWPDMHDEYDITIAAHTGSQA